MSSALAYVALVSIKNKVSMSVRKLKNARYLISAIFGFAYFFFVVGRNSMRGGKNVHMVFAAQSMGTDITAGIIFVLMLAVWAWPTSDPGVDLSESEVHFFFSSPVRRRDILLYKFLRAQLGILISAVMTTFFMGGIPSRNYAGMWFFFGSMSLYITMVQQLRARLKDFHIGFWPRLITVAAIISGAVWWAVENGTFRTPLHQALFYIPRFYALAALPNVALNTRLLSLAVISVIGVLCFLVSATVKVDFQEGSIANSQRKANAITRQRSQQSGQWIAFKRLPPPFRLADIGTPDIAIIWKNLIASLRIGMMPILIMLATLTFLVAESLFVHKGAAHFIGGLMLVMCAVIPLLGANICAQDLRLDITRIEYLKTFPLSGERVVAAEMAAPLIVLSIVELVFLTVTAVFLHTRGAGSPVSRFATPQMMVMVFTFTIPVCAILTVMRNAAVLMFPAWIIRSKEEPRGFVVTGQRLVVAIGNLIVLAVALIPAAIVFIPAFLIANYFFHGSPGFLAIATLPSLAVIAGEVWVSVRWLGKYFDGFDASNELDRVLT